MLKAILRSETLSNVSTKHLHLSSVNRIKEIVVTKTGDTTVIEGKLLPSPREPFLVKVDDPMKAKACPLCRLDLDVKHTDVLIIKQFLRSNNTVLPKRITGLCCKQQKRISYLALMAKAAGLLSPERKPVKYQHGRTKPPHNSYYDESTIDTYGW